MGGHHIEVTFDEVYELLTRCATNFANYLCEFKAIFEKALTGVSEIQGKLI
jgi:hypothetical protein